MQCGRLQDLLIRGFVPHILCKKVPEVRQELPGLRPRLQVQPG